MQSEVERLRKWAKDNPFTAEQIGAAGTLLILDKLRGDLQAAFSRIANQKELLQRRAEKK